MLDLPLIAVPPQIPGGIFRTALGPPAAERSHDHNSMSGRKLAPTRLRSVCAGSAICKAAVIPLIAAGTSRPFLVQPLLTMLSL